MERVAASHERNFLPGDSALASAGCGHFHPPVIATQPFNVLPRPAMAGEFVPEDYFRQLGRDEICRGGRPLEVDLGCGDGSFLMEMAREFPERDFLGVERLLGRVRKVCKKLTRRRLENVRVLRLDSRYVVEWLLPDDGVSRLHLLCPDPWPKLRHNRRRLVQAEFLEAVRRVLGAGWRVSFHDGSRGIFPVGGGESCRVREIRTAGVERGFVFLSEDGFPTAMGGRGEIDVPAEVPQAAQRGLRTTTDLSTKPSSRRFPDASTRTVTAPVSPWCITWMPRERQ